MKCIGVHFRALTYELLKIKSKSNILKIHNYYLFKVFKKKISHLTLLFHSQSKFSHYKQFRMECNMKF